MYEDVERPMTIQEMVQEITEYEIENLSWGDIKTLLVQVYAHQLAALPPERLQERYDAIFNR